MITSRTHEIIQIPRFVDPVRAFDEICIKSNKNYLEESDDFISFVQKKGEEWRNKANFVWLITCGFLPYADVVSKKCLPIIDYANHHKYIFDESIYACDVPKMTDILYDKEINPLCPNCGGNHENSNFPLVRFHHLWDDFPIFASLDEFGKNFQEIMINVSRLNYKYARIKHI